MKKRVLHTTPERYRSIRYTVSSITGSTPLKGWQKVIDRLFNYSTDEYRRNADVLMKNVASYVADTKVFVTEILQAKESGVELSIEELDAIVQTFESNKKAIYKMLCAVRKRVLRYSVADAFMRSATKGVGLLAFAVLVVAVRLITIPINLHANYRYVIPQKIDLLGLNATIEAPDPNSFGVYAESEFVQDAHFDQYFYMWNESTKPNSTWVERTIGCSTASVFSCKEMLFATMLGKILVFLVLFLWCITFFIYVKLSQTAIAFSILNSELADLQKEYLYFENLINFITTLRSDGKCRHSAGNLYCDAAVLRQQHYNFIIDRYLGDLYGQ